MTQCEGGRGGLYSSLMAASIRGRLPVRLPEWMLSWPEGIRPSAGYATVDGVELLLIGADGRWALVKCRCTTRSPTTFEARTLDIDEAMAARADVVAHAFAAALRRTGAAASRWLQALAEAARRLEADSESMAEWHELLDDRIDDPDTLTQLAMRSESPTVAAAVLHRLVARGRLHAALTTWERFGVEIAKVANPAMQACAAMMQAITGDSVAALGHARRLCEVACDPITYQAAGATMVALREYPSSTEPLHKRARLDRSLGAHEHAVVAAALAADRARVLESVACARALGSENAGVHVDAMLRVGAYDVAEQTLREQLERHPDGIEWCLQLAAVLLRRGQLAQADALGERAIARVPEHAGGHVVRGAVAVLSGAHHDALAHLDRALELDPQQQEALLWHAEASLKLGEARTANRDLFAAAFDDTAVWQLLFALVRSALDPSKALHGPLAFFHRALLRDVHPTEVHEPAFASDDATRALLWQTLARFSGSRASPFSMFDAAGRLVPADELASTQVRATRWQHRLLTTPVEQVLDGFVDLAQRYPDSPHPHTYTAEIELWLGNYETAWQLTDDMWQRTRTRWAYIGSGAALGLLGRFDEALERWEIGRQTFETFLPQEATYCYRGEVYRLLGRFDDARSDLEQAATSNPTRVGAYINLALVYLEHGDNAALEQALAWIAARAPLLVWEASRAAGVTPSIHVDRNAPARVLEHALRLMRGNRSSVMHTFVDDRGRLRVTPDEQLSIWQRWAASLDGLPSHGLGTWLLERASQGA
jgi:tetratricopeptide (TPR) repeat protein